MNKIKTLLDTDYEEYIWEQEHPPKSAKTCAGCQHFWCIETDAECNNCNMFCEENRKCKCSTVEKGKNCPYYEKLEDA